MPKTEAEEEDHYPAMSALHAVFGSCSLVKIDNQKVVKHEPSGYPWDVGGSGGGGGCGLAVEEFLQEDSLDDGMEGIIISSKQENRERSFVEDEAVEHPLPLPSSPTAPAAHGGVVLHSLSSSSGLATPGEASKRRKKTIMVEVLSATQPLPPPQISSLAKFAPKVEVDWFKGPLKGAPLLRPATVPKKVLWCR